MRIRVGLAIVFLFTLLVTAPISWASVALQSFAVTPSGPGVSSGVFASIGAQSGTPHTGVTSWPVTIDVTALSTLPSSLVVNFPDRASVTLTRGRYKNRGAGAFLWTGRGGDCSAVFSVAPVVLHGVISCLNANYAVEQAIGGGTALTLKRYIDDSSAPLAKPLEVPSSPFVAVPSQPLTTLNNPPDTVIDILVIYNEATRLALDPNGGKAATVAFAQFCVDTTQQAMDLSTTGWQPGQTPIATVNLVAAKEVAGPSSPQFIFDYQNYAQTYSEPMALRNLYAADAVVYLVENGISAYGVASIPGSTPAGQLGSPPPGPAFAPLAIAVVQRNTAVNDDTGLNPKEPYVFPHEFAHLIGANHDAPDAGNNTTPLTAYAYGWYAPHPEGGARTIMSYIPQNGCTAPCTRILNYSNPAVFGPAGLGFDWFRTGNVASADNALIIADYASYTAQYRPSLGRIFYDGFDN